MAVVPDPAERPAPMGRTALAASLEQAHERAHAEARDQAGDQPDDRAGAPGSADGRAAGPAAPPETPPDAVTIAMELLSPDGRANPYPLYAAAHRLGPVSGIGGGWFVVAGYDAVNQVLRRTDFGVTGAQITRERREEHASLGLLAQSILETDPPEHTRVRSLIGSVFTQRRVMALEPMIAAAVDALLDRLAESGADGEPVDFMAEFAFQLPVTVICDLLGVPAADRQRFRTLAAGLTTALEFMSDPSGLAPADAAATELAGYFSALIADRRTGSRTDDDLVGALLAARDAADGRLSESELLANLTLLLVAGFETTTDLLGNGLGVLFDHPDTACWLRSPDGDVAAFVEEVLRYESPVQLTSRVALTDGLEVAGIPVPAGSRLILLLGAANRDPSRYQAPDAFDPSRTTIKPLSFGVGAHVCLGNGLARLEAAVAFPRLLSRFPALTAAAAPTRRDRAVLRGYQTFPVLLG
ncbi:cytochrome P450 [Streptomyces sp. NBC_01198]|uniref:cytochrome P450 n=1 Tax=Streptomyces sp. NBC_01198 TaxID=2903769 RepID=UPI002E156444|nr:cytochrome P450 [Streptomyces sp. NBC_01198]